MRNVSKEVCLVVVVQCWLWSPAFSANNRPVVGVLLQQTEHHDQQFIAASYVKFVESAGARVIPVFLSQPDEYYRALVSHVNGLLLPGHATAVVDVAYESAATALIEAAVDRNNGGTYFAVWGTELGLHQLVRYFVGNTDWLSVCAVDNVSLPVDIEDGKEEDYRLFNQTETSAPVLQILRSKPVTANFQRRCLNMTEYSRNANLTEHFYAVGSSTFDELQYASLLEHTSYPFYGSAFHPEMAPFEFVVNQHRGNTSTDRDAVLVAQYFANFVVNEARKNDQHFANKLVESEHLIYNFNDYRHYTGKLTDATFEEEYRFPSHFAGIPSSATQPVTFFSVLLITAFVICSL